ncbi:hypothetical protein [uncultured Treponema sp.]|uniref:hypothetical protein n=1 Tax=uncultured Treponema sp. TaxID=162155 RepID=UPI0026149F9B|nr:hypothetical protein [uncultured Treponema sp.]
MTNPIRHPKSILKNVLGENFSSIIDGDPAMSPEINVLANIAVKFPICSKENPLRINCTIIKIPALPAP